jgi:hypothetical protein
VNFLVRTLRNGFNYSSSTNFVSFVVDVDDYVESSELLINLYYYCSSYKPRPTGKSQGSCKAFSIAIFIGKINVFI